MESIQRSGQPQQNDAPMEPTARRCFKASGPARPTDRPGGVGGYRGFCRRTKGFCVCLPLFVLFFGGGCSFLVPFCFCFFWGGGQGFGNAAKTYPTCLFFFLRRKVPSRGDQRDGAPMSRLTARLPVPLAHDICSWLPFFEPWELAVGVQRR